MIARQHYRIGAVTDDYGREHDGRIPCESFEEGCNLVSSELRHGEKGWHSRLLHAPAIDIDHHVRVMASSTPGHNHLYIDVEVSWRRYRKMLKAMVKAGIVEPGYYRASKQRRATFLRAPWVKKTPGDLPSGSYKVRGSR